MLKLKKKLQWISASVNEIYSDDEYEGIEELCEGDNVILFSDGTWEKA